ncbi:hypothetical protein [Sphingobacterium anhuiense]|uniref:Uncharacterized protein n=1 Tax=Sphingobacterium anhuiense TaxID=493780 RepID=A0ABW5YX14_9SPHI
MIDLMSITAAFTKTSFPLQMERSSTFPLHLITRTILIIMVYFFDTANMKNSQTATGSNEEICGKMIPNNTKLN